MIATPIRLEKRIYTASPAGNWNVKNPNMIGISHSIIWLVWADRASIDGMALIFCCAHIDAPTRIGRAKLNGAGAFDTRSTRSMPMNMLSSGTSLAAGFHPYRTVDRFAVPSGVAGTALKIARYRPNQIGICNTIGPRQPTGLTPAVLYIFIVSADCSRRPSGWSLYRSCIAFMRGCNADILRILRVCITVSGIIRSRTVTVKKMIARPKLLNSILSSKIRAFTIGPITKSSNRNIAMAMNATPTMIKNLRETNLFTGSPPRSGTLPL